MKWPITNLLKALITITTILICSTALAVNEPYYSAIKHVKERRYEAAEQAFRTIINEAQSPSAEIMRSNAWLALTLLAQKPQSPEAEKLMRDLMCGAEHLQSENQLKKFCEHAWKAKPHFWQSETQMDFDVVNTAITTTAAMQWHKGEYQIALELMNLALQQSMDANPSKSRLQAFDSKVSNNTQSATDQLASAQIKQALIKEQMKEQLLKKMTSNTGGIAAPEEEMKAVLQENQQALMESLMAEMIAKQRLPNKHGTEDSLRKKDKKLARVAASEQKIFQRLSNAMSCQNVEDDSGEFSLQAVQNSQLDSIASALEAFRGQGVQSFKIIQRPTLKILNTFLDSQQTLLGKEKSPFADNDRVSRLAIDCFERLKLQQHISRALLVALVRPARPHRSEKYLKQVIDTARRLRNGKRFDHSSHNMQVAIEHYILGTFYLRSHQNDKALVELDQAYALVKPESQLIISPEIVYLRQIFRAKVLQAIAQVADSTGQMRVKKYLATIQHEIKQLEADMGHQLSLSPEQVQQLQLDQVKHQTSSLLQSEEMQRMMQNVDRLVAKGDGGSANPSAKLGEIANMISSGAMDKKIIELQKNMESHSPIQQEDVLGLAVEKKYQFYNNHLLLLLQLVHIQLTLNETESAKELLTQAELYEKGVSGWIGKRSQGYLLYTRARLLAEGQQFEKATAAYAAAVNAWYFTPRSAYQILWSPLISETEILENAVGYAVTHNNVAAALNYIELARDVRADKIGLYGTFTSEGLAKQDRLLQSSLSELVQMAKNHAQKQDELEEYNETLIAAKHAESLSNRALLDKSYPLLRKLNAIMPWLEPSAFGPLLDSLLQQVSRRQAQNLDQKRIDFLYQQQDLVGAQQLPIDSSFLSEIRPGLLKALQKNLTEDSLLISIWMGEKSTYIIALDKSDIRAHLVPSQDLIYLVKAFNTALNPQHGVLIYEKLLAPYLDRPYSRIITVTNGPLRNTPLAALNTMQEEQSWLGDKYLLRTLPTASQLLAKPSEVGLEQVLVLDGSAVPGEDLLTTSEVSAIKEVFSAKHIPSEDLSKDNLIKSMPNSSVVHFAGHSKVNDEFPDFSYLALFDEKAYAIELEKLPLKDVKLLVLGSCESAAHANSALENEFSSLQDSFLTAGADAVVANLFPVNDQVASDFMSEFYKELAKGLPKDRAIQIAQQSIRASKPSPRDWAGFVLSGSEAPL